jgi:RNA polymerase sigma-70 factor (ECF subfamily)
MQIASTLTIPTSPNKTNAAVSPTLQTREKHPLQNTHARALEYFGKAVPKNGAAHEAEEAHLLLRDFAGGDGEAFWKLWVLYKGHLYHLCLWQMDGIREDAEDALSRVMLKAHEKLPCNAHQIQNVRAWLSKLTMNLCIDVHRERKRQFRRVENIDETRAIDLVKAAGDSPEDWFLTQEALSRVRHAVADLPPRLREPFVLRFFQEMTYDDIATRLTLSAENVRKRIQQARDILKDRLRRKSAAKQSAAWRSVEAIL